MHPPLLGTFNNGRCNFFMATMSAEEEHVEVECNEYRNGSYWITNILLQIITIKRWLTLQKGKLNCL